MLERSSFDDVMKQLDVVRIFDSDDGDDDEDDDECNLIDEYHCYLNNMNELLNVKDVHYDDNDIVDLSPIECYQILIVGWFEFYRRWRETFSSDHDRFVESPSTEGKKEKPKRHRQIDHFNVRVPLE